MRLLPGFALLLLSAPAAAEIGDRVPADGRPHRTMEQIFAAYGERPIDSYAGTGTEIVRAYTIDAWGRESPLVTFERAPGRDPRVRVKDPLAEPAEMAAPVTGATWDRVVAAAQYFDRDFVPLPPREDGWIVVCADGITTIVEAIDRQGAIRRKSMHSCEEGLAEDFGRSLAREASDALPACAGLLKDEWTDFYTLRRCAALEGDRYAAAQIVNLMDAASLYELGGGERTEFQVRRLFDWSPGDSARSSGSAWWAALPDGHLFFNRVVGMSATHVAVFGTLEFYPGDKVVPVRLDWEQAPDDDFKIVRVETDAAPGDPAFVAAPAED